MRLPSTAGFALMLVLALALQGCQPALNWREVRPGDSRAQALFPCKPDIDQRAARPGAPAMGLASCEAAGARFALSWADAPDPTQAAPALKAMPQALADKLGQALPTGQALKVPGMTPMPEALQYRLAGAGGITRLAVFAHGGRVYQAVMVGPKDDARAWDGFVEGLRVGSGIQPAS